jgi:hypothetical protein
MKALTAAMTLFAAAWMIPTAALAELKPPQMKPPPPPKVSTTNEKPKPAPAPEPVKPKKKP